MTNPRSSAPHVAMSAGGVRYGPDLRVLIVGGGVAGLTLAALLQRRGFAPVVVERLRDGRRREDVMGLWPSASNVLKGLGVFPAFEAVGHECARCIVANEHGHTLHTYSFGPISERYGPLVNVFRADLLRVLLGAVATGQTRVGASVRAIVQTPTAVTATFDDGTTESFDALVGCDGVRSVVRRLAFGDARADYTGMTGWSFAIRSPIVAPPEVMEYWGTNKFVATYQMGDRLGVLMAMRAPANTPDPAESRVARLRTHFAGFGGSVPWILGELDDVAVIDHDDFNDISMDRWDVDRVVLIGDAAHGGLPMSALGGGLAMESASVLAEELCRTDSSHVATALARYVACRRARVDRVQRQSRRLGRMIFGGGRFLTRLRNRGVQLSTDEVVLDEIDGVLAARI